MSVSNRLPKNVFPKNYKIKIIPNLKTFEFYGETIVDIEVTTNLKTIILHCTELTLKEVTLFAGEEKLQPTIEEFKKYEKVTFTFDKIIPPGRYSLEMKYLGLLNDKMRGLYRSVYRNAEGEEKYSAVTQFESMDARRCFPCWDEPAFKATFDLTVMVQQKFLVLSNMPLKKRSKTCDIVLYEFERTPLMSTYLLAFVVGEYDYIEDKSIEGTTIRVYTPIGKTDQGTFALEFTIKALEYYKNYFNIPYNLPKLDLITIRDFSAGAMENWGLITFREDVLLVDKENTSASTKQLVAAVVAHELAHQWFGNLVTMEWWSDLWLNEGYASFMQYLCVEEILPEYNIWSHFLSRLRPALYLDAAKASHPIEVDVEDPSEVFDVISYAKGAAVLRMLHHYLGDENFRKGMNLYLTRYKYKNCSTDDLWKALEEASGKPISVIMPNWTKQMGFPLLIVTKSIVGDANISLTLTQQKFNDDGSWGCGTYVWMIPIGIITSKDPSNEVISTVLDEKEMIVTIPEGASLEWIKINPRFVGFYRVKYPQEMLNSFIEPIKNKLISPFDRLNLLDDLHALAIGRYISVVEVLKFLWAYQDEDDFSVWKTICFILYDYHGLFSYLNSYESFIKYEQKILKNIYTKLGWDLIPGESLSNTMLRELILSRITLLDNPEIAEEAKERFDKHLKSEFILPPDLRAPCYIAALRGGFEGIFETLLDHYETSNMMEEKERIGRALGAINNPEQLQNLLLFIESDKVRPNNKMYIIGRFSNSTREIKEKVWDYLKGKLQYYCEKCGYMATVINVGVLMEFCVKKELVLDVENAFKSLNFPFMNKVTEIINKMQRNIRLLERYSVNIEEYLSSIN